MKRSAWKWLLGISSTVLILLVLFIVGVWALSNATAAFGSAIMSYTDNSVFEFNGVSFGAFLSNFVGSPVFYILIVDMIALLVSLAAMAIPRKG